MQRMKVIILCGGQGTRLREETEFKPKPMVMVGDHPILWHIMKMYGHYGYTDFVLCLGYKGDMIKEYFLNYRAMNNDFTLKLGDHREIAFHGAHREEDFRVTLANTGADAMTGSRVKQVEKYVTDDLVCVTYGDGLSDVNVEELVAFHRAHGKIGTVTAVRTLSRFGVLEIDGDHRVTNFAEKPQAEGRISAGMFVFNRGFFQYLSEDPECVMEQEPLRQLARDGQLMAYQHDGFFYAMDTYREALKLNELWESRNAPWAHWQKPGMTPELRRASEKIVDTMLSNSPSLR
jgi:glucose-1-phosphate cytidylyltransferase